MSSGTNHFTKKGAISDGYCMIVIDFEAMVRDPAHPTRLRPEFDCGDCLNPNDVGYRRMGNGIDLTLFSA
jgi:hypothetical protein